ncbi:hypothetical protein JCM10450v2_003658 [Rhodotorula kratochvilovae]
MTGLRPPSTPRASLGPGSNLPTPSSRRKSGVPRPPSSLAHNGELSALRQAMAAHDPASYASASPGAFDDPDSPFAVGIALGGHPSEGSSGSERAAATRQPVLPGVRAGPTVPKALPSRPTTPSTPSYARARTPTGFGSSTSRFPRPASRQAGGDELRVGREVTFEVSGEKMEGTLRFVGEVEGKSGQWGGVELDAVWAGRGKNDGSVAGVQYFACPPQCGLFLPLAKVAPKPKASMPPPLTAGSRASRMAGMSAKDLASRRTSLAPSTTTTPSAKTRSPTKPRTSMSPTKPLSASTSTLTTPKPTRLGRPSIGGTPTTARKSLGATPRASLGASIKRPPSSLRTHSAAPDVPPIPSAYGLARSVTPSSQSGRATPSTPGAMIRRRTSLAQSELGASIRPSTPSLRSSSRQSFASSVSRQSQRSTASHATDTEELDDLRRELAEAQHRESEIRQLLEGSERLGREMEDRLTEKNGRITALEERLGALEKERERARKEEDARLADAAAKGGEEGDRAARVRELEKRVEEQEAALEAQRAAYDKLKLEDKHKTAAKEAEVESLRERLEHAAKEHDDERADLNSQIDKLRSAGQALCETYEEKIAEIELARLEAVELAEVLQLQLDGAPGAADRTQREDSPATARSLSASVSAAQAIDAENARAELDHLRDKVAMLEEQLEDARMQLEQEYAEAKTRRSKMGEAEQRLKGEIASLKEAVDRSAKGESRLAARIDELQAALQESQATLEAERSELEGLRHDASGDATAALADDLKRVHKELAQTKADLERTQRDAAQHAGLVTELREDLCNAEKEIERLQKLSPPSPRDLAGRRSSSSSSIGGKDEATATRDQIVGLKSIIETLTEENKQLGERNKAIEGETDHLKDAQRALEATVENLMAQLDGSAVNTPRSPSTVPSSAAPASEASVRRELDELRTQLKEVQRKSELEIKALNQEVTELESLVEAKIYREDELETELAKLKALTSGAKVSAAPANGHAKKPSAASSMLDGAEDGECEMCGEKGHDLDSCPDFAASSPTRTSFSSTSLADSDAIGKRSCASSVMTGNGVDSAAEWCDDCEEFGHALEDCPLASEIF